MQTTIYALNQGETVIGMFGGNLAAAITWFLGEVDKYEGQVIEVNQREDQCRVLLVFNENKHRKFFRSIATIGDIRTDIPDEFILKAVLPSKGSYLKVGEYYD